MISSQYVELFLLLISAVGSTTDLEIYSQAAELGTEFIINITNKFCAKVLTTITLHDIMKPKGVTMISSQ
ncbi:hypothetical protein NE548_07040, partial [Lactobacillus gasseri]|uniref:hypothetical protein n=1 Tax=Lactobacillus gasseri TaxID=1596 RepID=UPI00210B7802